MIVCIPYFSGDREQAIRLIGWLKELGSCENHDLLLVRDQRCQPITDLSTFGKVHTELVIKDDHWNKWPESANHVFCTLARYLEYNHPQYKYWLYLEPDCVPLTSDFLDQIETQYKKLPKPFMGAFVPRFGDSPDHCSGIAVYPNPIVTVAGLILMSDGESVPFDLYAAGMILPQTQFTTLIQHRWDRPPKPPVTSMEDIYKVVTKECVLFHGDKGGSWIEVLRKERGDVKCAQRDSQGSLAYAATTLAAENSTLQAARNTIRESSKGAHATMSAIACSSSA